MTIDQIHKQIDFILDKAHQGYLSPEEKDRVLNRVQYEFFEELKPAYGANMQLHDYLRPFRKKLTLINGNTANGVITIPTDYFHLLHIELSVVENGTTIHKGLALVGDDEVSDRKNSQLIPPSRYPFVYFDEDNLQIYPAAAVAGVMRYLRKPAECVYGYTQTGRTITYDPGTSVQLEWNEPAINKIILKAVQACGVPLQNAMAIQYAAQKEASN